MTTYARCLISIATKYVFKRPAVARERHHTAVPEWRAIAWTQHSGPVESRVTNDDPLTACAKSEPVRRYIRAASMRGAAIPAASTTDFSFRARALNDCDDTKSKIPGPNVLAWRLPKARVWVSYIQGAAGSRFAPAEKHSFGFAINIPGLVGRHRSCMRELDVFVRSV